MNSVKLRFTRYVYDKLKHMKNVLSASVFYRYIIVSADGIPSTADGLVLVATPSLDDDSKLLI